MGIRASKTQYSGLSDVQIKDLLNKNIYTSELREKSNITELEREIKNRINNLYDEIKPNSLSLAMGTPPMYTDKININDQIANYKNLLDSLLEIKTEVEKLTAQTSTRGSISSGGRRKSKKARSKRRRRTVRK
uniref:Uncharacterized protein n=1 Tax=viral metagenome TaxID=1070528 RepID=A0A6C0DH80_9ZZZZ